MTPDELWEKYSSTLIYRNDGEMKTFQTMDKQDFSFALAEYGAAVRKRDAEICRQECLVDGLDTSDDIAYNLAVSDCAAAISREPLP